MNEPTAPQHLNKALRFKMKPVMQPQHILQFIILPSWGFLENYSTNYLPQMTWAIFLKLYHTIASQNLRISKILDVTLSHLFTAPNNHSAYSIAYKWQRVNGPDYPKYQWLLNSWMCLHATESNIKILWSWVSDNTLHSPTSGNCSLIIMENSLKTKNEQQRQSGASRHCSVCLRFSMNYSNHYEISKAAHAKYFRDKGIDKVHLD